MAKPLTNKEISTLLRAVSAAYEVKGEDRFRVIAYENAAASIETLPNEVKDLWDEGKLEAIPGVGKNIQEHLDELFKKGKVKHFEELFNDLPRGMFTLLPVPGIGAKIAFRLASEFKLNDPQKAIESLLKEALKGKIRGLEGFGEKSEDELIKNINAYLQRGDRLLLPEADKIAQDVLSWLKKSPEVEIAEPLGSLRRMVSTIGDIDIAVASHNPDRVIKHFLAYPGKRRQIEAGENTASIMVAENRQVDLMIQPPSSFGALLQHFTGSKLHNIALREYALTKGFSLSEYGIKIIEKNKKLKIKNQNYNSKTKIYEFSDEKSFYIALGLDWISPELREGTEEISLAKRNHLPKLVKLADIKGDLHVHSNFPIETSHDEGVNLFEEIILEAEKLNYEYLAFTEHNPSYSRHSIREVVDILKRKKQAVERCQTICENRVNNIPIRLLNSLEVDIRPNGDLAIPSEAFDYLDFVMVSVHSSFEIKKNEMTKRILKALSHPKVKILGHPTGRKLNQREEYELDWEKIFEFCLNNEKILEINSWPDRLDLPDYLVKEAVKNKVKMVINTDSHQVDQLSLMKYGVSVARRGWAQKEDILNTLNYDKIKKVLST